MQFEKSLKHPMYQSPSLSNEKVGQWLNGLQNAQALLNAATSLTAPSQFWAGVRMAQLAKSGAGVQNIQKHSHLWPSIFTGIAVIANRMTPSHRDRSGRSQWYDLLLSCGTDEESRLVLSDIDADIRYCPGDACFISGAVLQHEVMDWKGGNRLAYAHYHRAAIAERMGVQPGNSPFIQDFSSKMDPMFLRRHQDIYRGRSHST